MKITVMTADEQIITLDVDSHESVTLRNPVFVACVHTRMRVCLRKYTRIDELLILFFF